MAPEYEEIYERFLKGVLIYRPHEESDEGKIEMPIAELANPLEGTFDLSLCGDAGKYLSIATGYRKGKKNENAYKVEVWLTPLFLIENELQGPASHFTGIMGSWDARTAPFGAFFTWGGWNDLGYYDYVTHLSSADLSSNNFYEIWRAAHSASRTIYHPSNNRQISQSNDITDTSITAYAYSIHFRALRPFYPIRANKKFHVRFVN